MAENVSLKISSAVIIGGKLVKAGEVIEVSGGDAKDLLHRGKAKLATSKPVVAIHYTDEVHVPEAPAAAEVVEPVEASAAEVVPAAEPAEETAKKPAKASNKKAK